MNAKQQEKEIKRKQNLLIWILSHWDCYNLDEAKKLAKTDKALNMKLREAGIQL